MISIRSTVKLIPETNRQGRWEKESEDGRFQFVRRSKSAGLYKENVNPNCRMNASGYPMNEYTIGR